MDEGWPYNGRCSIRLNIVIRFSNQRYALNGPNIVTLTVYVHYKSSKSKHISSTSATMEMEQAPHIHDGSVDLNHTKPFLELNQPPEEQKRKSENSPEMLKCLQGPAEKRTKLNSGIDSTNNRSNDRFVYGNPKDTIKPPVPPPDVFESNNVLDLSCKNSRSDDDRTKSDVTYQNFPRNNHPYLPDAFPRSNLEIKLVNTPSKRHSTAEQLQIAKLQQQQRRSVQQQQKMLQQMRRTLDAASGRPPAPPADTPKKNSREDPPKEELNPALMSPMFPPYPYYDAAPSKELPDGHPILPLLDPVYFSALYNAHGFMPPSSPSIAAAFISTLQDALPKLSMMFPPNPSTSGASLLPQKSNENPN